MRNAWQYPVLDILFELTKKEMKIRYKNTYLGYVWSILSPLAFAMALFFAFRIVMRVPIENYALFLVVGLFPWQWISNSVSTAANVFVANSSLIKKTTFPRELLAYSIVLNDLIHFVLALPVVGLFLVLHGLHPTLDWLVGLPVLVACQATLIVGISLVVGSVNLFFRDLERLVGIGLHLFFYLTPVVYAAEMIPPQYRPYLALSPFTSIIDGYHQLFLRGTLPLAHMWWPVTYALVAFVAGYFVYSRLERRFAEVL
jgi:lipopolysaccharide transport system permease protein